MVDGRIFNMFWDLILILEELLSIDGVTPHIYGKKITKPFRKMGHVTIVNSSIEKAKTIAKKIKESVKIISK